jgi:hypothetical protein
MITYSCTNCGWEKKVGTVEDVSRTEELTAGVLLRNMGGKARLRQTEYYYSCPKCHHGGVKRKRK